MKKIIFSLLPVLLFAACSQNSKQETTTSQPDSTVVSTARAAYLYAMPLALMDMTLLKRTNYETPTDGWGAPINQFYISSSFPNADVRDVIRPNADTYYNQVMLDLSSDAMVLSLPDTKGRYYLMPMMDAWTNVFASPGKRTTGTEAITFLITGPNWKGEVPNGMKQIEAPTNLVWIPGRMQVNSAEDGNKIVVPLEKKVSITPLNSYGKAYKAPKGKLANINPASPNEQLQSMPIDSFFNYVNRLMVDNPPLPADGSAIAEFSKIGVGPDKKFNLNSFDTATQETIKKIPAEILASFRAALEKGLSKPVNGWSIAYKGFATWGTNYQIRAAISYLGLGMNLPEDAINPTCNVDSEGNLLDGANRYVMHFEKGQLPPVNAFWSITLYDKEGYFVHNPLNRYNIGDRSNLKENPDGSFDIYVQTTSPGKDKESNWLPCPADKFGLVMRMYWPKVEALDAGWAPAAVKKVTN